MAGSNERRFLVHQLEKAGIGRSSYSFGEHLDSAYFLTKRGGGWAVYHKERGVVSDLHTFKSESAAGRFLLGTLIEATGVFLGGYTAD